MNKNNDAYIINKLLSCLPLHNDNQITVKSLFGGSGISCNEIMFAWVYEHNLYLRGHPQYLHLFVELNMQPLAFDTGVMVKLLQYYQVTDQLWQNEKELITIIQMVIEYSLFDKELQRKAKESRIKDLPNMNLSLERSLFRAGITNVAIFRQQGAFKSYLQLTQINKNVSKNVLFILHSALTGIHVATLTETQKKRLKKEYHEFIQNQ